MKNSNGGEPGLRKGGLGSKKRGLLAYLSANQKSLIPRLLLRVRGEMTFAQNDANPKTPELGAKESLIEFMHKASEE